MSRKLTRTLAFGAAASALALLAHAAGEASGDWPQFRGARRDGCSAETGLLKAWPEDGPKQVWRRPIGEGYSGVAAAGGRLFTMYAGEHEGQPVEFAAALDPATGEEIWRKPVGKKYEGEFGHGPRSTPTVNGDLVVVLGAVGDLKALSAKDGSERWHVSLVDTLASKQPFFGYSASPILEDGKVILEAGGKEGKSIVAFDVATGKLLWASGDDRGPGYNSPLAIDAGGSRQYVQVVAARIRALDGSGKEVWTQPWTQGETHAIPIWLPPDRLLVSGVEGVGAVLYQLDGASTMKELWKNPTFRTHFNAGVVSGDHVYGFDNATLKCLSLKDGSLAWAKRGLGKGSLILADGHLVILSDEGQLLLAEATPSGFVQQGSVQALQGRCWTPPTLAGGKVIVRNYTEIVSYAVKG